MLGKRVLVLSVAATVLLGASSFAASNSSDVVATVNGEKITKEALTKSLYDWYSPMAVQEVILSRLVGQEAKKAGVVVSDAQVKARLDEIKARMLPPGMDFSDYLRQTGHTPAYAQAMIRMNLQAEGVLRKNTKVTPADLANYRKATHILILTQSQDPKEKENKERDARAKIDQIAQDLKDNKISFEDAATKYSEDPGSKTKGGDLGWFTKGRMVPEFEAAVFKLKPGEVSTPVKTTYGYHIIKLTASGDSATGADRKELEKIVIDGKTDSRAVQAWVMGLQSKAKIVNTLGPKKPTMAQPAANQRKTRLTPLPAQRVTNGTPSAPPPPPGAPASAAPAAPSAPAATTAPAAPAAPAK